MAKVSLLHLVQPSVDRFSVVKNTFMGGDVWRR